MRYLFFTLLCCFCAIASASSTVEIRFVGSPGNAEGDRVYGALLVNALQRKIGDECLIAFDVGTSAYLGNRFTLHISADPDQGEELSARIFRELEVFQKGRGEVSQWLERLRAETISSVEYFAGDRALWEEFRESRPFVSNIEETTRLLEQFGYGDTDFQLYDDLYQAELTREEADAINYILLSLAEDNILMLAIKRSELDRQGAKIEHLHPLVFLGYIARTPLLQQKFHQVAERRLTWKPWVEGFVTNMKLHSANENIDPYLPGFCHHTGGNPVAVKVLIKRQDYEGLMRYFF